MYTSAVIPHCGGHIYGFGASLSSRESFYLLCIRFGPGGSSCCGVSVATQQNRKKSISMITLEFESDSEPPLASPALRLAGEPLAMRLEIRRSSGVWSAVMCIAQVLD